MHISDIVSIRKAEFLWKSGKTNNAIELLDSVISKDNYDHRALIQKAIHSKDFSFLTLNEETLGNPASWLFGAADAFECNNLELAACYIGKALQISPKNNTALALSALVNYSNGTGDLLTLAKNAPAASLHIQALILVTVEKSILLLNKNYLEAKEDYDDTNKGILGKGVELLDNLAIWLHWFFVAGVNFTLNIVYANRSYVHHLINNGDRDHGLGRLDAAIGNFKAVLKVDSDNVESLVSLVMLTLQTSKYDEAQTYAKRLMELCPVNDYPQHVKWLADVHYCNGILNTAYELYFKSFSEDPREYMTPYRLGLIALLQNNGVEASKWFEAALSLIHPGLLIKRLAHLKELMESP